MATETHMKSKSSHLRRNRLRPLLTDKEHTRYHVTKSPKTPSADHLTHQSSTRLTRSARLARDYEEFPPTSSSQRSLFHEISTKMDVVPRRHSAVLTPGGLASRVADINISSPLSARLQTSTFDTTSPKSIMLESRQLPLSGVDQGELERLRKVVSPRQGINRRSPPVTSPRGQQHDLTDTRLRRWGHIYFGNFVTADAFVKSVRLITPNSQITNNEEACCRTDGSQHESQLPTFNAERVTIRAKVLPRAKERKPFIIQRHFNIEELRASALVKSHAHSTNPYTMSSNYKMPVDRIVPRSQIASSEGTSASKITLDITQRLASPRSVVQRVVPIHLQYALRYLPILAALMLSGHIRRGDSIELPLPFAEAWVDTLAFIYTGRGDITGAMKSNILYLAGDAP